MCPTSDQTRDPGNYYPNKFFRKNSKTLEWVLRQKSPKIWHSHWQIGTRFSFRFKAWAPMILMFSSYIRGHWALFCSNWTGVRLSCTLKIFSRRVGSVLLLPSFICFFFSKVTTSFFYLQICSDRWLILDWNYSALIVAALLCGALIH